MNAFNPIYFGDEIYGNNRFVAVCKDDMVFVGDAARYDIENKDRATVVWCGNLSEVESIDKLIEKFPADSWKFVEDSYRLWMVESSKNELIVLYSGYAIRDMAMGE